MNLDIHPTDLSQPFGHDALFYRDDDDYLAGTLPFIRSALAANEPVAAAVPEPRLSLLRGALGRSADRVRLINMSVAGRNPGRIIPEVLRAFADDHPAVPVRIIGEPIWPSRSDTEYPACVQHEALINLAFAGRDATILCPYDVTGLKPGVLADAAATHPTLVDGVGARVSAAYAPERILRACNRRFAEPAGPATVLHFQGDGALEEVRAFAAWHATRLGLAPDRVPHLEVAVNELAANSLVHAGGAGRLRVWAEDHHLICEVRDNGRFTDPLAGRRPAGLSTDGGRGLLLVHHIADLVRMHTTPAGTAIRLYWRLPLRLAVAAAHDRAPAP